jgi:hypothetical protein
MVQFFTVLISAFIGKFIFGGLLLFYFGHEEDDQGNIKENRFFSTVGMVVGALIGALLYRFAV